MDAVLKALQVSAPTLLGLPNVVGVGRGDKFVKGESTGRPAVTVLVKQKLPKDALQACDLVPMSIADAYTDVIEVGEVVALGVPSLAGPNITRTERHRPAMPGVSAGHYKVSAGTFGAVVYDIKTGEPLLLSNCHVFANSSNGKDGRCKIGDPIYQPGPYDGGKKEDTIATLHNFVPVYMTSTSSSCPVAAAVESGLNRVVKWFRRSYEVRLYKRASTVNLVDAATARPLRRDYITDEIVGIGVPKGMAEATVGMKVRKSGRTSGLNSGTVKVVQATIKVGMGDAGDATFSDQIVTTHIAQPGDSGSLVVNEQGQAVGLLSAGSDTVSIFGRMKNVCDALSIRL